MKIEVKSSGLESRVKNLCKVIDSKPALPILSNIVFEVDEVKKTAVLTASDSEIWLSYTIELIMAEDSGKFCVSADTLSAMLSGLPEQPVVIEINPVTDILTLTHANGSSYCPIEHADEFPPQKNLENGETMVTAETKMLKDGIKRSLWAAVKDDLRPIMNGVYFKFEADHLDIVASNGHQLMKTDATLSHMNESGDFVMPRKVAKILPDLLINEYVDLTFDENCCRIEDDQMAFYFRFIEGTFPNYNSVIPQEFKHTTFCNRVDLIMALQSVSPFTPNSSNLTVLKFKDEKLEVTGDDLDFSVGATQKVDIFEYDGEQMSIGIKAAQLITMLQKIQTLEVNLKFNDGVHALVITPYYDSYENVKEDIIGLCMPLYLNDSNDDNNGQASEG
jgi:DNA polymerase-3 subunit beta